MMQGDTPQAAAPQVAPPAPVDPNAERRRMMLAQMLANGARSGSPWTGAGAAIGTAAGEGINALIGAMGGGARG